MLQSDVTPLTSGMMNPADPTNITLTRKRMYNRRFWDEFRL
jgi:hypothetical protein